jgi:hypothetical protein
MKVHMYLELWKYGVIRKYAGAPKYSPNSYKIRLFVIQKKVEAECQTRQLWKMQKDLLGNKVVPQFE